MTSTFSGFGKNFLLICLKNQETEITKLLFTQHFTYNNYKTFQIISQKSNSSIIQFYNDIAVHHVMPWGLLFFHSHHELKYFIFIHRKNILLTFI